MDVGENFEIDEGISQAAARQNGNIMRRQLFALGLNDVAISYRVRQRRRFREFPGVYSVGRPATTPLERATAAVLACGNRSALAGGSAMTYWGFWKRWEEPFEVCIVGDRRPKGIRVHRVTRLL